MVDIKEIAKEIVNRIKTAKPIKGARPSAAITETEILAVISALKEPKAPPLQYWEHNKAYVHDILKWIENGQRLLSGRRDAIPPVAFFSRDPTKSNDRILVENVWVPGTTTHPFFQQQLQSLKNALADMQEQCNRFIQYKIGADRRAEHNKKRAALAAFELLEQHGRRVQPNSPTSAFRQVAGLFFQAMTGSDEYRDIERPCESVAREWKAILKQMNTGTETTFKN
jgi:hypothetical protein